MQFKLAILTVLAKRRDGRATLDELNGEVESLTADEGQPGDLSSALDDIDLIQSGLVIADGGGLQITDAGRSVLNALENPSEAALDLPSFSHSLKLIDGLIGTEKRLKIFDLELRRDEADFSPEGAELGSEPITVVAPDSMPADAPGFLVRDASRSEVNASGREVPRRSNLSRLISVRLQQALADWRRHLERDTPNTKTKRTGNVSGAAIALLSLLTIVICAGAVIALIQIRSLRTEVVVLQRELSPLRERAARADLLEKAKQNADQQKEVQNKSDAKNNGAGAEPRTKQPGLNLTPEEIRLIRDFIKPAPAAATPAPAINVGDTFSGGTIPLPSPLMEKIPKLLGARFTTHNGSIIIVRRDSRQADAVLPPN